MGLCVLALAVLLLEKSAVRLGKMAAGLLSFMGIGIGNWDPKFDSGLSHRKCMFFVNTFLLGMRIMGLGRF